MRRVLSGFKKPIKQSPASLLVGGHISCILSEIHRRLPRKINNSVSFCLSTIIACTLPEQQSQSQNAYPLTGRRIRNGQGHDCNKPKNYEADGSEKGWEVMLIYNARETRSGYAGDRYSNVRSTLSRAGLITSL